MASAGRRIGGIVLCGGKSSRMGRPKMWLPFGPETMLQRVVRIVGEVVDPVAVVAAANQELPALPEELRIVRDEQEGLGPLGGLAAGLAALQSEVEAAYASSCDVPLLKAEFVRQMAASLEDYDLVILRDGTFHHPLAAVYRTHLAETIRALLETGHRRPISLLEECRPRIIEVETMKTVDPNLESLRNANRPEDYEALLREAGLAGSGDH